jgi:hypothetical protein
MSKTINRLFAGVLSAFLLPVFAGAVVINEIRIDEPGDDVNEYFELKGTPGESLDGLWYVVIGDHSNFGNPDENAPWYGAGGVEFAFDLTGFFIEDDGYFLIGETLGFNLADFSELSFDIADLIFENGENVTHLLVSAYTGVPVEKDSDQWGDKSVDIDDDNDGNVNTVLPWTAIIDGVSVVATPNEELPEGDEPNYGPSLGVVSVGPNGAAGSPPWHVFRDRNTGEWKIGVDSLIAGVNLDTPGTENSIRPGVNSVTPSIAEPGGTITITGTNFVGVESVKIGEVSVEYTLVSETEITAVVPGDSTGGPVTVTTLNGVGQAATDLRVLEVLFLEDFETSLGDFLIVSLAGENDWRHRTFGGNGFAQMGGYGFSTEDFGPSEDWLISPEIDLTNVTLSALNIATARAFGANGPDLEILISTTYTPGVPSLEDWTAVTGTLSSGTPNYDLVESGPIDLSAFDGEVIRVAFRYTCPTSLTDDAPTWQVHEMYITGTTVTTGDMVDDLLGLQYHYDENWAYNYTMGFVYLAEKPWVYSAKFGWIYIYPGTVTDGTWGYFHDTGDGSDFAYLFADWDGLFQFGSTGEWASFLNP